MVGDAAQGLGQIVFGQAAAPGGLELLLGGRGGAAERANQELLARVPARLATAGRAGELLSCCDGIAHLDGPGAPEDAGWRSHSRSKRFSSLGSPPARRA